MVSHQSPNKSPYRFLHWQQFGQVTLLLWVNFHCPKTGLNMERPLTLQLVVPARS